MLLDVALIAVILGVAVAVGRLTRRHLPELVSWLAVGALLGPSGLAAIPRDEFEHLRPLIQIATAALMFLVGERLSLQAVRRARWLVLGASSSYVGAAVCVYLGTRLAGADESLSLLLATVAGGGAPMTVAALGGGRRRSVYGDELVAFHAGCDLLAAMVFAAILPLVVLADTPGESFRTAARSSVQLGLAGMAVGVAAGLSLSASARRVGGRAVAPLAVGHVAAATAVCAALGLSIPLCGLVMGAVTATRSGDRVAAMFGVFLRAEFPLYLLFFTLAGAAIRLDSLPRLGLVGLAYIVGRAAAKLTTGAIVARERGFARSEAVVFGLDTLPQAGVAVALAAVGSAALPGRGIATITLGSIVIFETIGAAFVSRSLDRRAGPSGRAARLAGAAR